MMTILSNKNEIFCLQTRYYIKYSIKMFAVNCTLMLYCPNISSNI